MATGERLTVTYSHPPSGPLKVDVYCYAPSVDPVDPSPNLSRLPFLLFLHGGHFFTGSKRDVPPWLASLARSLGTPLLCADYRLAPHAGPSHAFEDLQNLWKFLQTDLQWIIACSGNGAEVESGTDALAANFTDLQRRGGIDTTKGVIVGVGAGGYLAAIGGGFLSPPPIALVLGYGTLDVVASAGTATSEDAPKHIQALLKSSNIGNDGLAASMAPDMPLIMRKAPYASTMREAAGMDEGESWAGKEESQRRSGVVDYLLSTKQWAKFLCQASPGLMSPSDMLTDVSRSNWPYPPTIAYHGMEDTMVPASVSRDFIDSVRKAEPVAAAIDALSLSHSTPPATSAKIDDLSTRSNLESTIAFQADDPSINVTSRYIYLGIRGPGAGHGFDALLPRLLIAGPYSKNGQKVMGDRYKAGMIKVEHFVRHWLAEGSAVTAAKGIRQPVGKTELKGTDAPDRDGLQPQSTSTTFSFSKTQGAKVRLPRGAPRL